MDTTFPLINHLPTGYLMAKLKWNLVLLYVLLNRAFLSSYVFILPNYLVDLKENINQDSFQCVVWNLSFCHEIPCTSTWTFLTLNVNKNKHFWTTYPPYVVHVAIQQSWLLFQSEFFKDSKKFRGHLVLLTQDRYIYKIVCSLKFS